MRNHYTLVNNASILLSSTWLNCFDGDSTTILKSSFIHIDKQNYLNKKIERSVGTLYILLEVV